MGRRQADGRDGAAEPVYLSTKFLSMRGANPRPHYDTSHYSCRCHACIHTLEVNPLE